MKILFREPINQPLKQMEVGNDLESLQKLIGGYIQEIYLGEGVYCIIDEEGRLKGLGNNFFSDQYGWIVGNAIFCSSDGAEFASLTDKQIKLVANYIGFPVVK